MCSRVSTLKRTHDLAATFESHTFRYFAIMRECFCYNANLFIHRRISIYNNHAEENQMHEFLIQYICNSMDEWSPHSRFIHSRFARSSKAIVIKASDVAVTCACRDLQIGILLKLSVVHCILHEQNLIHEIHVRDIICSYVYSSQIYLFSQVRKSLWNVHKTFIWTQKLALLEKNLMKLWRCILLNICTYIFIIYVVSIAFFIT